MRQDFFQAIGLADIEKVHSAIIGWVLSDDCQALDIKVRSVLLNNIFGVTPNIVYKKIDVIVETHNIDILIITQDAQSVETCWIIENKIKSSQHSNQLNRYVSIINGNGDPNKPKAKPFIKFANFYKHYCFLTLVNETPQCQGVKWENLTYCKFASYIEAALKQSVNKSISDYIILKEYLDSIKKMVCVLSDFLKTPQNYLNVFTDGSKQKDEKNLVPLNINDTNSAYSYYIGKNNLETVFQKCYLSEVLKQMNVQSPCRWTIGDTRGNALIDYINYVECKDLGIETHIQIQNGSFKVFLSQLDDKSETKDSFKNKWMPVFEKIENKDQGWSINQPRNKPSLSISKHDKKWLKDFNDVVSRWISLYKESVDIQKKLIAEICNTKNVLFL